MPKWRCGTINTEKVTTIKWFDDAANWFALFVKTYEEQRVAGRLQGNLDVEKYAVFVPTKDYAFKKQGNTVMRKVPWLSGYVFVASMETADEFRSMVEPLIKNDSAIFKLLSNGSADDSIALSQQDKAIMTSVLDENFNIAALKADVVNGKIEIDEVSILKKGDAVIKVDKHKQTAIVRLALLGKKFDCEFALEF
jgi:transcription antitermination factor NusG